MAEPTPDSKELRLRRIHLVIGIVAGMVGAAVPVGTGFLKAAADRAKLELRVEYLEGELKGSNERQRAIQANYAQIGRDVGVIKGQTEALLGLMRRERER